jgi:hypothetical protein
MSIIFFVVHPSAVDNQLQFRGHNIYFSSALGVRPGLRRLSARPVRDSNDPMNVARFAHQRPTVGMILVIEENSLALGDVVRHVRHDETGETGHAVILCPRAGARN